MMRTYELHVTGPRKDGGGRWAWEIYRDAASAKAAVKWAKGYLEAKGYNPSTVKVQARWIRI